MKGQFPRHAHCQPTASHLPDPTPKGRTVSIDQATQDIRALFDWSKGAEAEPQAAASVANDDLELALQLLACNPRDRQQFQGNRGSSH